MALGTDVGIGGREAAGSRLHPPFVTAQAEPGCFWQLRVHIAHPWVCQGVCLPRGMAPCKGRKEGRKACKEAWLLGLFCSHSAFSAKELFPPTFLKVTFIKREKKKKKVAALQVCKHLVLQTAI